VTFPDKFPQHNITRRVRIPGHARCVFRGQLFSIFQWQERLYDGSMATFEMARRPDNVIVIGIGDGGRLLVTIQRQPGIPDPFFDFPGGRVEGSENRGAAAAREMLEETGFAAGELKLIYEFQPSDRVDSITSVFRATDLVSIEDPTPDKGEQVRIAWLELRDIRQWAVVNNRLALVPVLLARDVDELCSESWLAEEID
jgi:ADP-ribose pyrophosphatase